VFNKMKQFFDRLGISRWSRLKKIVIGVAGLISLLIFIIIISNMKTDGKTSTTKVTLMSKDIKPKKDLNYEFVKFDTIKIPTFPRAEQPLLSVLI